MMRDRGDIDIDLADRGQAMEKLGLIPASMLRDGKLVKHNTGVYFHAVPKDPITGLCSLPYDVAEARGCFKIDLLNVGVYADITDESHLIKLMTDPLDWRVFEQQEFVQKLFHLNNYSELTAKLKPRSIEHIAMILALIRPGKKHLQDKCMRQGFDSIRDEIWHQDEDDGYTFKKAHSISYAMLVYVHANLLIEQSKSEVDRL